MNAALTPHARRGFALPAAIMALVLLSALVAGALFISTGELRAGRTDLADQRALATAEWALARTIAEWDPRRNTALAVGATEVALDSQSTTGDRVVVTTTRVQRESFLVTAYAASGGDGSGIPTRHTIAASLRLQGARIQSVAALTAAGAVTIDRGIVDGANASTSENANALCDEVDVSAGIGISVPDTLLVCGAQCTGATPAGVTGAPPVTMATGLTSDSAAGPMGRDVFASIAARASVTLVGGTVAPRPVASADGCDRTDALNWGDPGGTGPCRDHYALVHVTGSLVLAAGSVGQGILIVDGSLRVDAGARFVGVVIAGDDIAVIGIGAELVGAAIALDGDRVGGSRVADGGAIQLAGCAVRRALIGTSRLTRTPVRWWAELR